MTAKTRAAKAFAEKYGIYSEYDGEYVLAPRDTPRYYEASVTSSLNTPLVDLLTRQRDEAWTEKREALERVRNERAKHDETLRLVMGLLGVEDQYQDTVETKTEFTNSLVGFRECDVVTEPATAKFAADLRAAQSALDGAAALKRLRKAIKNVQKEADK